MNRSRWRRGFRLAAFFGFFLGAFGAALAADPLTAARADLLAGQAPAALEKLAPLEDLRAGDPEYDYLLGVAVLESGNPSRASMIFERVLTVDPNHAAARLDLGRAFFAMGAYDRAQDEFDAVRAMNPPPDALKTIEAHESAMRPPEAAPTGGASAWVELGYGHDSNVNQATGDTAVYLPVFNATFNVSDNNRERSDTYQSLAAGARYAMAIDASWSATVGAEARGRWHSEADLYDNASIDLNGGLQWRDEAELLQLLVSYGPYWLDGEDYRQAGALSADWRKGFGAAGTLDVFAQFYRVRYDEDALRSNDVDLRVGGVGWLLPWGGGAGLGFVAAFGGAEEAVVGRADGDKDLIGARAGVQQRLGAFDLGATLSVQQGSYRRQNPIFLGEREDTQTDLVLNAAWQFDPAWSLRFAATLTQNDSNFAIYDYDRQDVSLAVRYDYR